MNCSGFKVSGVTSWAKEAVESVGEQLDGAAERINKWASAGTVGRWFGFKERDAKFTVECRAGFITFLMVSYVLAVNPNILITTGGTCNPQEVCTNYDLLGPSCLGNANDPGAQSCLESLKANLITATAASGLISTGLIGLMGNLPLALAPGIGITTYVAYHVVGQYGQGQLTYQQAMTAIFVEGWIFIILSVTGVRGGIIKFMPKSIAMASSVGIGLLLAFTGLQNLGVLAFDENTFVTLGGCHEATQTFIYSLNEPLNYTEQVVPASNGTAGSTTYMNVTLHGENQFLPAAATVHGCSGGTMRSATMWLGISGGILMALCLFAGVKGSLVIGILFVTVISWIPGHGASYLGAGSSIAGGELRMETFKNVVALPSLGMTGFAWDWSAFSNGHLWLALFTFLYIDLLDCTGTLLSMARLMDLVMPGGFVTDQLEFPGQMWAFLSDGLGILGGSMMGSTPNTVYIESAAGIEDGGRTGLTALVVSFFFFVSLFFSPILASIPPYATGPALVLAGSILLGHTAHIVWDDIGQAIPAFLTIIIMPFTFSVASGVIAGLASYVIIHLPFWLLDLVNKKLLKRGENQRRACESRARVHHKFYLGSGRAGSGSSLRGAGGSDGDLTYQSTYQSTYNSTYGSGAFPPTNQTLSQRGDSRRLAQIFSHVAPKRSMSMQPPLSQGSLQSSELNASSGKSSVLRRSLTAILPNRGHSTDSAFTGGRASLTGLSRQQTDASDLEAGRISLGSLHHSGSSDPLPGLGPNSRPPLPRQESNAPRALGRSNSHTGLGGLAAMYPQEDLEQRGSSSCHHGTAYADFVKKGPAKGLGGDSCNSLGPGGELSFTDFSCSPSPSPAAPQLLRSSTAASEGSHGSSQSTLVFRDGKFQVVPSAGSEDPSTSSRRLGRSGSRTLHRMYSLQPDTSPRSRGHRSISPRVPRSAEPTYYPPERVSGGSVRGRDGGEGSGGSGGGGGGEFRLFGDVQLQASPRGGGHSPQSRCSPRERSAHGSVFRLFGERVEEVHLGADVDGAGGSPAQPASAFAGAFGGGFKLFGDVEELPLEEDDEGQGEGEGQGGSSAGFQLFPGVELDLAAEESEGSGSGLAGLPQGDAISEDGGPGREGEGEGEGGEAEEARLSQLPEGEPRE